MYQDVVKISARTCMKASWSLQCVTHGHSTIYRYNIVFQGHTDLRCECAAIQCNLLLGDNVSYKMHEIKAGV